MHSPPETCAGSPATVVTFELAGQVFAVPVKQVREILDRQDVTRLPNPAPDCIGVIDARGQSIPVVDLASRLGLSGSEAAPDRRIVIFEVTGGGAIGALTDRVLGVLEIEPADIEPAPANAFARTGSHGVAGLVRLDGRLATLLEIGAILDLDAVAGVLGVDA